MQIKEITDKTRWENFILSQSPNTFLHSWNWGEFNKLMGDKIFHLGIFDNEKLAGVALVIKVIAKRGKFLFCPHGPIIESSKFNPPDGGQSSKFWNTLFDYLKNLAKKEDVDFVRISPLLENTPENLEIFSNHGFRNAPVHMMHPEIAWLLDISKSEEEIFSGIRKTTRNIIRRAEKEGIEIAESKENGDIEKFYSLHEQTVGRHKFVPFPKDYLKKEFEVFSPENQISVFFAKHNSMIISSAIIVFYDHSAFYHHGASLASKIPASHLLIWEAIKAAKKRGCEIFNFWGIAPEGAKNHPWAGLTFFKTGFGGYKKEYLHAQDLVISHKYWLNYLIEKIRRFSRGY